jgi:enamine deaminase RidA (YjgF/YER057c/UK114 family)
MMSRQSIIQPSGLHAPGSYSHVMVTDGPLAHVAGQVAVDQSGQLIGPGDFGRQAEQAFGNLATALAAVGSTPALVVSLTIYVVSSLDRSELAKLPAVLAVHFPTDPPAITLLFVTGLMRPEWLVEVQTVAALSERYSPIEKIMLELGA